MARLRKPSGDGFEHHIRSRPCACWSRPSSKGCERSAHRCSCG